MYLIFRPYNIITTRVAMRMCLIIVLTSSITNLNRFFEYNHEQVTQVNKEESFQNKCIIQLNNWEREIDIDIIVISLNIL